MFCVRHFKIIVKVETCLEPICEMKYVFKFLTTVKLSLHRLNDVLFAVAVKCY